MQTHLMNQPPAVAAPAPADWRALARCAEVDPELWFPAKGEPARIAKRICAGCPVQSPCLEFALRFPGMPGVWGGASERERRAMLRERRAAA